MKLYRLMVSILCMALLTPIAAYLEYNKQFTGYLCLKDYISYFAKNP